MSKNNSIYIGIGSNLDHRNLIVKSVILNIISNKKISYFKISNVYKSLSIGSINKKNFINLVMYIKTTFNYLDLLIFLQKIEILYNRKHVYKNSPRTIDIDILFFKNNIIVKSKYLNIPHIEIQKRGFVLQPILEIDKFKYIKNHGYILILINMLPKLNISKKIGFFDFI